MGRMVSVHCEGCGLPPTDLLEGRGRMATLFQPAPGFCHHCNTPQTLEVVAPCVDLRALRDGAEVGRVEVPKDQTELLSLIVRLRERPRCERCGKAARRLDLTPPPGLRGERRWQATCPRCEEETLIVGETGMFD